MKLEWLTNLVRSGILVLSLQLYFIFCFFFACVVDVKIRNQKKIFRKCLTTFLPPKLIWVRIASLVSPFQLLISSDFTSLLLIHSKNASLDFETDQSFPWVLGKGISGKMNQAMSDDVTFFFCFSTLTHLTKKMRK